MKGEMKGPTTLSLDREKIEKAKMLGVNISKICQIALDIALDGVTVDGDTFKYIMRKHEMQELEAEIASHEIQLQNLNKMKTMQIEEFYIAKVKYNEIQKSSVIAGMMRAINTEIVMAEFDADVAWETCGESIRYLAELGYEIDRPWFDKHVERLAKWM